MTAFDIAPTALRWCRHRFPDTRVRYIEADLLAAPEEWTGSFDFVFEAYTPQVLPTGLRAAALCIPSVRPVRVCDQRAELDDHRLQL